MQAIDIHFDSRNYFYHKAIVNQSTSAGNLAPTDAYQLPDQDRSFYWTAKGSPIFYTDLPSQARFRLIEALVEKGQNIVSLNADIQKWDELAKYAKRNIAIGIRQHSDNSQGSYTELVDENTALLYLATIGDNLAVPDFQKVIRFAHARGILVVVDNTAGAEGILFDPITWGADYVISNLHYWHPESKRQGQVVVRSSSLVTDDPWSSHTAHITDQTAESKIIPLPTSSYWKENAHEVERVKGKLNNTLNLAKWLLASSHTERVIYPGLPSHHDHFNTLKFFRNGFGNQLLWVVKGDTQDFDLLKQQFRYIPVPGVKIIPVSESLAFKIEVRDGNLKETEEALLRVFSLLRNQSDDRELQEKEKESYAAQFRGQIEEGAIQKLTSSSF